MQHIVKSGDNPSKLADHYVGDQKRWKELCVANPNLQTHPDWGCVFPAVGTAINLPESWVKTTAPDGSAAEATTSLEPRKTVDMKVVLIGAVVVVGAVLFFYSRKKPKMSPNRSRRARRRRRAR